MSMGNGKKRLSVLFFIGTIFLILAIILITFKFSLNSRMLHYLESKYDLIPSQITVLEHSHAKFNIDYDFMESTNVYYFHNKWICEANGKRFEVKYFNFHFVDDYQLEDLENWITKYFQTNVNSNIVGTVVYSNTIFHDPDIKYYKNLPYSDNRLWQESEIETFIKQQYIFNQDNGIEIFINKDTSGLNNEQFKTDITSALNKTIFLDNPQLNETDITLSYIDINSFEYHRVYEFLQGNYGCQNILEPILFENMINNV